MAAILVDAISIAGVASAASGSVRFYAVGTLTQANCYSDDAATVVITQPVSLDSSGRATSSVYLKVPARMIVQDSAGATVLDVERVDGMRTDTVSMISSSWSSAATANDAWNALATSLGSTNGNIAAPGASTSSTLTARLGRDKVDVISDFGATGDGVTDDTTTIQAAINYVGATKGGGVVWLPIPTVRYRITAALSIANTGVVLQGASRAVALRNESATGNAISVATTASADSKVEIRDLTITHLTTSSGAGIVLTTGDNVLVQNVAIALHRKAIDGSAVTAAVMDNIIVASTDDNASAVGITLGTRGRIRHSEIISGTTNGTGISAAGTACRVSDTAVTKFTTGITISGTGAGAQGAYVTSATTGISIATAGCAARQCTVQSCTTGISLGAASTRAVDSVVTGATSGFSVGAFDGCVVMGCYGSTNTADLVVNASATNVVDVQNTFTTRTDTLNTAHTWLGQRAISFAKVTKVTDSTAAVTVTPTPTTCNFFVIESSYAGAPTVTVAATATTGLTDGQLLFIGFQKITNAGQITITLNAQYLDVLTGPAQNFWSLLMLMWKASAAKWVSIAQRANIAGTPF